MIVKALVEEVIDSYHVRVRIPLFDRTPASAVYTKTEDLNVASICVPSPQYEPNIRVGDVVFVAMEDTIDNYCVILGFLHRSEKTETYSDSNMSHVTVINQADLPETTTIGEVTAAEIHQLIGVRDNIQKQIDALNIQLEQLLKKLFPEEQTPEEGNQ